MHDAGRMRRLAGLYATRLGLDVERLLAFSFAHAGLSASWDMNGFDPSFRLKCLELLGSIVS